MIPDVSWSARRVLILTTALVVTAFVLHCAQAARRSAGLLEHDEAISLLAAAGKAEQMDRLHIDPYAVDVLPARRVQDFLRPTDGASFADVFHSLARCDIHPPLYFLALHAMGRVGFDLTHAGRLFGTLVLILGAWCANRWIWPQAAPGVKLLAAAWLLLTPTMVDVATELRQYILVYLGLILSLAALARLWEETRPTRTTCVLLAVAPVILLWSQYGTLLWVVFGLVIAVVGAVIRRGRRWRLIAAAAVAVSTVVLPLLIWGRPERLPYVLSPEPLTDAWHDGFLPICRAAAGAWCDIPWRWQGDLVMLAIIALVLTAALVLAWTGGNGLDRWLLLATVAWTSAWLLLLASGRLPPHAVEAKQLGPLLLCPMAVIVRAGSASRPRGIRLAVAALLAVSLLTQTPRSWRLATGSSDDRSLAALSSTECLWVDAPRRGYLLPLVEKVPPDSRVVIAGPFVVLERWEELDKLLPSEHLLYAEINGYPDQQRAPVQQAVVDRFSERYEAREVVLRGPRRTVTEFLRKRTAIGSPPAGKHPPADG